MAQILARLSDAEVAAIILASAFALVVVLLAVVVIVGICTKNPDRRKFCERIASILRRMPPPPG